MQSKDGGFFFNPGLCRAVDKAISRGIALHVLGFLSPSGGHSHEYRILVMLETAIKAVETVDASNERIEAALKEVRGVGW